MKSFSIKNIFFLFIFAISIVSCGKKEKITAFVQPKTLSGSSFEINVPIEQVDVPAVTGDVENVPIVGRIFGDLASSLADMTLIEENGKEIEVEPQVFEFPDLDKDSFSELRSLFIKNARVRAIAEDNSNLSLHFIRSIEVYLDYLPESKGTEELTEQEKARTGDLILSFNRAENSFCDFTTCLNMSSHHIPWKKILENNKRFIIRAKILVDSVPKEKMRISGNLAIRAMIDPGF